MGTTPEPRPWHRSRALVFVDDPHAPVLSTEDAHHLSRVLRLRPGDEVCVADGSGRWRMTTFEAPARLLPAGEVHTEPAPVRTVTIGLALVKGDKPDLVVQKLTELGVDRIVLFHAARSVARWNAERTERNLERLTRIARSAARQSRRLRPPVIEISDLTTLLSQGAVVADFGGRSITAGDAFVLIGPEGGWDEGEYGSAERVGLGPNVLRAETAAIAAAVRLTTERDALGT